MLAQPEYKCWSTSKRDVGGAGWLTDDETEVVEMLAGRKAGGIAVVVVVVAGSGVVAALVV